MYLSNCITDSLFNLCLHPLSTASHITPMNSAGSACESVGILGELAKTQALNSLLSCPLLEDLNEWSQWELVFRPLYGPLKDFIERNAGSKHQH